MYSQQQPCEGGCRELTPSLLAYSATQDAKLDPVLSSLSLDGALVGRSASWHLLRTLRPRHVSKTRAGKQAAMLDMASLRAKTTLAVLRASAPQAGADC